MGTLKLCRACGQEKELDQFFAGNGLYKKYHRCKPCAKNIAKIRRTPDVLRAQNMYNHFGMRPDDYIFLFEAQKGKCALCFKDPTPDFPYLNVDHSHEHIHTRKSQVGCPECIRGLLCTYCNLTLGFLERSPHLQNDLARHYLTFRPLVKRPQKV